MNNNLTTISNNKITEKLQDYAKHSEKAFSPNTMKAIRSDLANFKDWCTGRNLAFLPAKPETLRLYVDWGTEKYKPASIKRHLSSIAHLHRAAELTDGTKHYMVKLAIKRMNRTKGTRQKQARGLTKADVHKIIHSIKGTPRDIRDLAMIMIARDILARSNEIVALNVEDLEYGMDGSGVILIRKSKTDQDGQGAKCWVSKPTIKALKTWLKHAKICDGPIFQSLNRGGHVNKGKRLNTTDIYRSFQRLAKISGIEEITGHSCRVGMAQDLMANNTELSAIMHVGRWKNSEMPIRYSEHMAVSRGAIAKFYDSDIIGNPTMDIQ